MAYDNDSGKVWGVSVPPPPAVNGGIHLKQAMNPMTPGLMTRHVEKDPYTGSTEVELGTAINHVLASGDTQSYFAPGQYWSRDGARDYTKPAVVPVDVTYAVSGLPSPISNAYPALTNNAGLVLPQ